MRNERTDSGRKYKVDHVGSGATNPDQHALGIYLWWGYEYLPESEWEQHREDAWEAAYEEICDKG